MREITRALLSLCAAAGLFLALFLALQWNPFVSLAFSVGVYFGLFLLLKPSRKIGGISLEGLRDGEELQALLQGAQEDLETLERAGKEISKAPVAEQAQRLFSTAQRLMAYLKKNRKKIPQARRFFLYYLDTAARLLGRYMELENLGLHTQEVLEVQRKTESVLPVLNQAFERQFTQLMAGELLDTEVDIQVLEQELEGSSLKKEAQ